MLEKIYFGTYTRNNSKGIYQAELDTEKKVSVVQRFENVQSADITINNEIKIDNQVYAVKFKGDLVDSNFSMLGHVTLYFTEVPDEPQNNAIYLSPEKMPSIHVGSTIEY